MKCQCTGSSRACYHHEKMSCEVLSLVPMEEGNCCLLTLHSPKIEGNLNKSSLLTTDLEMQDSIKKRFVYLAPKIIYKIKQQLLSSDDSFFFAAASSSFFVVFLAWVLLAPSSNSWFRLTVSSLLSFSCIVSIVSN